ncbi:hypothetical protein [Amycolatopsis taiwanensis]|uniref:Uncharacterized protein n=1 Tax=Amycolatopsis taiwanensis TaxID=342230 RepID=A0A9W6R7Q8_9PSEU|nr:hypothetical protein [Amycolatopsis taiwanensis]GLY69137.1 hypothetical protein Atai01_57560 [Amycolatopsis taiwanensis]
MVDAERGRDLPGLPEPVAGPAVMPVATGPALNDDPMRVLDVFEPREQLAQQRAAGSLLSGVARARGERWSDRSSREQ